MNYTAKETYRIGKSVNVCLCDESGTKLYDRYVTTDAWGIDPAEVAAEIISYWEKERAKVPESVIIPEVPIEVTMTSSEALVKNIAVKAAKIAAELEKVAAELAAKDAADLLKEVVDGTLEAEKI